MPERMMFRSLRGSCNKYVAMMREQIGELSQDNELFIRAAFLAGALSMAGEAQRFLAHYSDQYDKAMDELEKASEGGDVHDTPQGHG